MGLDMYLNKRITNHLVFIRNGIGVRSHRPLVYVDDVCYSDVRELVVKFGYWRKANAIHGWFVREVQGGVDDCGTYQVSIGKLVELRELCKRVLVEPDRASELLPTVDGFYFGTTEYGEYYFKCLRDTVGLLTGIESSEDDYEYRSSW